MGALVIAMKSVALFGKWTLLAGGAALFLVSVLGFGLSLGRRQS